MQVCMESATERMDPPTDPSRVSGPRLKRRRALYGEVSGRYDIGSLLGRGGMGEVLACQDQRIGRTVAMKVLAHDRDDPETIERFVDEARLQGRLEHPAIVPVYDLGTTSDGTPFFTMKCVRGVTLAQILDERREGRSAEWSTRRLLNAFVTVCLAVEYAHRCGVVHGDLKPENVMLGRFGEVHVLDWGCASRHSEQGSLSEIDGTHDLRVLSGLLERTRSRDAILGTPGYIAPEGIRGFHGDPGSDVYALGVILFEILVGERLHEGRTPLARLVKTLEHPNPRPSARAPELVIASALDDLVACALREDARERPSAQALATGIEAYLDAELSRTHALRAADLHARTASEHACQALAADGEAERGKALQEAARALSLDPQNREAADVLARLLSCPPRELPADARRLCDAAEHGLAQSAVRAMSLRAWTWVAMIVPAIALGVHAWGAAVLSAVVLGLSAITFTRQAEKLTHSPRARRLMLGLSMTSVALMSGLFGPLVLTPVFATTTATLFATSFGRDERRLVWLSALAAVSVPLLLEVAGILPPSMAFVDGTIILLPRMVAFEPGPSAAFLAIGSLLSIPMVVLLGARLRDAVDQRLRALAIAECELRRALPLAIGTHLPR